MKSTGGSSDTELPPEDSVDQDTVAAAAVALGTTAAAVALGFVVGMLQPWEALGGWRLAFSSDVSVFVISRPGLRVPNLHLPMFAAVVAVGSTLWRSGRGVDFTVGLLAGPTATGLVVWLAQPFGGSGLDGDRGVVLFSTAALVGTALLVRTVVVSVRGRTISPRRSAPLVVIGGVAATILVIERVRVIIDNELLSGWDDPLQAVAVCAVLLAPVVCALVGVVADSSTGRALAGGVAVALLFVPIVAWQLDERLVRTGFLTQPRERVAVGAATVLLVSAGWSQWSATLHRVRIGAAHVGEYLSTPDEWDDEPER